MGHIHKLVNTAASPASDDALVGALLAFANGQTVEIAQDSPLRADSGSERSKRRDWLQIAAADREAALVDFFNLGSSSLQTMPIRSLKSRPVLEKARKGQALKWLREFRTAADTLDFAAMLLLNTDEPYGANLCRCRLPSCGKFYLAAQNSKGGPPNRNYCTPEHRHIAHDAKLNRGKK